MILVTQIVAHLCHELNAESSLVTISSDGTNPRARIVQFTAKCPPSADVEDISQQLSIKP